MFVIEEDTLRVAEIMGGTATLGIRIVSMHELADSVSSGLPKQALRMTAQRVFDAPREVSQLMYKLVPEATYKRRKRLTPAESARTERLARVIAAAEEVWEDRNDAREWLKRPHPELSGESPLQRGMSELGAREVEALLDQLFYGLPS